MKVLGNYKSFSVGREPVNVASGLRRYALYTYLALSLSRYYSSLRNATFLRIKIPHNSFGSSFLYSCAMLELPTILPHSSFGFQPSWQYSLREPLQCRSSSAYV
jgi:hypothetical protein